MRSVGANPTVPASYESVNKITNFLQKSVDTRLEILYNIVVKKIKITTKLKSKGDFRNT